MKYIIVKIIVVIFVLWLLSGCGSGSSDYGLSDCALNSYERNSYSGYMSGGHDK